MSVAELAALQEYTDSGYTRLNRGLRAGGDEAKNVKPFADEVKAALIKLRRYNGNVNRGTSVPSAILATYQPGNVISFNAFTSSAISSGFSASVRFVIHSRAGRFVGSHSTHEYENEVIFPPETKFKVLSRKDTGVDSAEIVLEEIEGKPRPGFTN